MDTSGDSSNCLPAEREREIFRYKLAAVGLACLKIAAESNTPLEELQWMAQTIC